MKLRLSCRAQAGRLACLTLCLVGSVATRADAQSSAAKAPRQSDVIYGRKFGLALTMEVLTPGNRNGLGVIWVVSSSGKSSRDQTLQKAYELRRPRISGKLPLENGDDA
jgi:hypothetical protein